MSHLEVAAAIQEYKTDRVMRKRWHDARENLSKPEEGRDFRPQSVSVENSMELSVSRRVSIVNASEWTRYFKPPPPPSEGCAFRPTALGANLRWGQ